MADAPAIKAAEVARILAVHPATLATHLPSLYRQGFPRPRAIGKCRRWSRQAVEDWLAGRRTSEAPSATDRMLAKIDAL